MQTRIVERSICLVSPPMAKAARNIVRRAVTILAPVVANDSGVVANGSPVVATDSGVVANGRVVVAGAFVAF